MLNIDVTKLPKIDRSISRCQVIDLGSGSAPKFVTVELPGGDGGRVLAYYTGFPANLAINDYVRVLRSESSGHYEIVGTSAGTASLGVGDLLEEYGIINGDMSVQQHQSGNATTTNKYFLDRWYHYFGSGGAGTISQESLSPADVAGLIYALRFNQTTGGTGPTLDQQIEGVASYEGQEITLSFWAKADSAISVDTDFIQHFGTGGSPSSDVTTAGSTHSVTTSWQRFTDTVTIPSISGKTIGSNDDDYLSISFDLPDSATFTLDITGVQIDIGSTAQSWRRVDPNENRHRCYRYFERLPRGDTAVEQIGTGLYTSTSAAYGNFFYHEKRSLPTITFVTAASTFGALDNGANLRAASAVGVTHIAKRSAYMNAWTFSSGSFATGDSVAFMANNDTTARIDIDAELK